MPSSEDTSSTPHSVTHPPGPPALRVASSPADRPAPWVGEAREFPAPRDPDRAVIEQAKGALMLRYGVGSYESLAALARWARDAQVTHVEVARALVAGICQGRVSPADRGLVRWLETRLRDGIPEPALAANPAPARPQVPTPRQEAPGAPDIRAAKRWRYTSAVHAARDLVTG